MKTGGSNYVNINWDYGNPVIGTYHLFKEKVASDLREMFEHGQRKIALVCWYTPLTWPGAKDHRWGHMLDCLGGVMFEQHQQNLVELLALIESTGFSELHFRFAASKKAYPENWDSWDKGQFNENWAFTASVRSLIKSNTSLAVIFDLGLEHARTSLGTNPLLQLYVRRMWKLYCDAHGPDDSCGFTIIHGPDGLNPMLNQFKIGKLPLPGCYCFDNYTFPGTVLAESAKVLDKIGEAGKPLFIEETFYNDAEAASNIRDAIGGLNFQGTLQWPRVRDQDPHYFPDVFPKRYDNYLVET